jgi:hypothetical protein
VVAPELINFIAASPTTRTNAPKSVIEHGFSINRFALDAIAAPLLLAFECPFRTMLLGRGVKL